MSRLLMLLSVVLVGAGLAVGNLPTGGAGTGHPAHDGRTAKAAREPVVGEPAHGGTGSGEPATRPSRPRRLVIDSLGIRAPVVPLETSGSTLYPPEDTAKVGWWREGAMPGAARGSALLTGHTVSDGEGVFDDLSRLRSGDRVRLVTERGVLRYVVRTEATYRRSALAHRAPRLFSPSSPGRLVLVTCEDWNGEVYLANHVVIAKPEALVRARPR